MRDAAAAAAGRGGRGLGGGGEAGLGEVGGVGEAGGVADDDPDAGAPVAAGGELLDLAVVEHGRRRPLVLGEDLGEVAAGAASAVPSTRLITVFFDHGTIADRAVRAAGHPARPVGWTDRRGALIVPRCP